MYFNFSERQIIYGTISISRLQIMGKDKLE